MSILAMGLRLVDPTSPAIPQGQPGLTSGQLFFIFLLALLGSGVLLYKSMKKQLGKIQMPKDDK